MLPDDTKFILWLVLISTSSLSACCGSNNDIQCLMALQQFLNDPQDIPVYAGYMCQSQSGVECWTSGAIMSLHLGNRGLQGQFPRGLQFCTRLTGLDLSGNSLSGPVPADICQQLPYLTYLNLSNNSFSGEITGSIASMTYLNVLNLQHNQFSGQIPEQIGSLARLTSLDVANNFLSGPVPDSLRSFPAANFTGNSGLCGAPLQYCEKKQMLHKINDDIAVGVAVGFVVAFYFPQLLREAAALHVPDMIHFLSCILCLYFSGWM